MPPKDDDYPFEGLSVCMPGMIPEGSFPRGLGADGKFDEVDETPTSPENPTAKRVALGERMCGHGLKIRDCEECRLMLEHGGEYSVINRRGEDT